MRSLLALPVLLALASAVVVWRSRLVWRLGPYGKELAPAFLFLLWLCGLRLGELAGSLAVMAWAAAAPLVAPAAYALMRSRTRRRRFGGSRWWVTDWLAFAFLAVVALVVAGADNICHYSLISTYLEGNIPPRALNDPGAPLVYHALFDAAAAVLVRAFRIDAELGLDAITVMALAAAVACLQPVSRQLFAAPGAQRLARLALLLGFGPVYLRLYDAADLRALHGQSLQPLVDLILRRPTALALVLFCFSLAALLGRFAGHRTLRRAGTVHAPPACLLPVAFLLPAVAEELVLLLGGLTLALVLGRRLALRPVLLLLAALALGAAPAGLARATLGGDVSMAVPQPALGWPPALPHWGAPADGVPLFSAQAAGVLLFEWGPLSLGALALAFLRGDGRRRALAWLAIAGLGAASLLTLRGWPRADLDRLLFWGGLAALLLTGAWVELALARLRGRATPGLRAAAAAVLAAALCAGPVALGAWRIGHQGRTLEGLGTRRERPGGQIREGLHPVGPREPILTDLGSAQTLILAGFTVIAPLDTHMVNLVVAARFPDYVARHAHRAVWLFLAPDDPRVAGKPAVAEYAGYRLVRAR